MEEFRQLSDDLQRALASNDAQAVEAAATAIASIINAKRKATKKVAEDKDKENHKQLCLATAKKYPCTACGGALEWQKDWSGYSIMFSCSVCGRYCVRQPVMKHEDDVQQTLQSRIKNMKLLLKRVIDLSGGEFDCDEQLTSINGQPLLIFNRQDRYGDFPCALQISYGRYEAHESMRSGGDDWSSSLQDVAEVFSSIIFQQPYSAVEKLRNAIRELPADQRFIPRPKPKR